MTIAQEVIAACSGAQAYTIQGGYAVHGSARKLFPPCKVLEKHEDWGDTGRVTLLVGEYADGSCIRFSWTRARGPRLVELVGGAK